MNLEEALNISKRLDTDLIETSPNSFPPACCLMDHGKYKYRSSKKKQKDKAKQKTMQTKEVKFTPNIGKKDYRIKMRQLVSFLEKGNKVKVIVKFKGRELCFKYMGFEILKDIQTDLSGLCSVEHSKRKEDKTISMLLTTLNQRKPKQHKVECIKRNPNLTEAQSSVSSVIEPDV
ncbi:Translation initiation factor IF-3 [Candidatus Tremblaya phenacola]|uniref:Translation initiation factor IF-3 n=2 Tax=Candidatus Tremblayella phenacoccinincola TaxID=1010676 RepID=A0A2G0V783_9PROT|nr:Translation initiation factor IF-3 [Candidatus Tremblaya phenacola]